MANTANGLPPQAGECLLQKYSVCSSFLSRVQSQSRVSMEMEPPTCAGQGSYSAGHHSNRRQRESWPIGEERWAFSLVTAAFQMKALSSWMDTKHLQKYRIVKWRQKLAQQSSLILRQCQNKAQSHFTHFDYNAPTSKQETTLKTPTELWIQWQACDILGESLGTSWIRAI